jgi:hypothetical protein
VSRHLKLRIIVETLFRKTVWVKNVTCLRGWDAAFG